MATSTLKKLVLVLELERQQDTFLTDTPGIWNVGVTVFNVNQVGQLLGEKKIISGTCVYIYKHDKLCTHMK